MDKFSSPSLALLLVTALTACSSTPKQVKEGADTNLSANPSEQSHTQTTGRQSLDTKSEEEVTKALIDKAARGQVYILKHIPYADEKFIADNVIAECGSLGQQFSDSVVKYAKAQRLAIQSTAQLPEDGVVVRLTIDNVYSAGNAFIGHRKSATVSAVLLIDGKEINKTALTRNSGGGFMGGFKGSCSVLAHTVNTLGNDVAKWLKKQDI
jgi:hypothetical protein